MLEYDHAPLGDVAFRATEGDLKSSAEALYTEAWQADNPEIAERLRDTAAWYVDLALDLAEINGLPETTWTDGRPDPCPFDVIGKLDVDPDEDIPF